MAAINEAQSDKEFRRYLKVIAKSNRWDQVMIRGCIIGLFSALGATIGLALTLFVAYQIIKQVPILDQILQYTKLDVIIENQINQQLNTNTTSTSTTQPTDNEEPTPAPSEQSELYYSDEELGIHISYPTYLAQLNQIVDGVRFAGEGALLSIDILNDTIITIEAEDKNQRFVNRQDTERITVDVYESGATVNGRFYNNALFYAHVYNNGHDIYFIGLANPDTPKLGREAFIRIMESLSLSISQ